MGNLISFLDKILKINQQKFLHNNLQVQMISRMNQMFKEEIILISHKLFQKVEEEGRLPNLFYDTSIILITKPDKDYKKNSISSPCEHRKSFIMCFNW